MHDLSSWQSWQMVVFAGVVLAGMELLNWAIPRVFSSWNRIPMKAKHLDALEAKVRGRSASLPHTPAPVCAPVSCSDHADTGTRTRLAFPRTFRAVRHHRTANALTV